VPPAPGARSPFWDQDGVHEVYRAVAQDSQRIWR
jgi:hypothetical protein